MPELPVALDTRVAALRDYGVLDTPPEPAFDDLAALAQAICGTRYAAINLVDAHRQWFKAEIGFGVTEMPLDDSICARVMLEPGLVEIPDLALDDRFGCNPLVRSGPGLRFYAGAPLINEDGHVLGTLCVLDDTPRRLDEAQRRALAALGRQVVSLMELRRSTLRSARHAQSLAEALRTRDAAQAELVTRNAAHRFVIERVLAGLVVHDANGAIVLANEAASRLLGLTRDQLLGRTPADPFWHFVREDGSRMPLEEYPISIVARTREPLLDYIVGVSPRPGAELLWVLVNAYPELDASGAIERTVVSFVDITALKNVESALRRAGNEAIESARAADFERGKLDALLDAAPVGIVYCDARGRTVVSNTVARSVLGEPGDATAANPAARWRGRWADGSERHGAPVAPDEWPIARLLDGRETSIPGDVIEIEPVDGSDAGRTLLIRAELIRDAAGSPAGAVLVLLDLTDRLRIEAALRESEARFRSITNAVPQMIWSASPDGHADYYSRQWYEFTGTQEGDCDGVKWVGLVHPEDRGVAHAAWSGATAAGRDYEVEYRLRHRSGAYRWVLARGVPVRDADGRIERWMGTCTDIHEQRLFQSALERSEDALREADRRKDEFLAMLGHELRNPLAPIATAAELLRLAHGDPSRVQSASEIITRQVRHLTGLVDDLLDVSRVTRGLIQLDIDVFDLRTAARAAVEQVRPLVESRRHALSVDEPDGPLWLRGDATRITQIIANLLNNAAKYTPPGGRIDLRLRRDEDRLYIEVEDSGQGIAAELLPHVFDLFTQAERSVDRAQGGLGIGLALVRSLTASHDGEVFAHSEGPGRGSRFTIKLPAAAAPDRVQTKGPEVSARRDPSLDIVIVDDNTDAATTLALVLELAGHRARTLATAAEALALPDDDGAQVFVLDIGLPDLSGHELAERLRRRALGEGALLYALTGYGQAQDLAASAKAGFDRHFVKPLQPQVLLDALSDDLTGAPPRGRIAGRFTAHDTR